MNIMTTDTGSYPGLFVTIEGVDGAGKSTVIEKAKEELHDVVTTREPSPLWTGPQVRNAIDDDHSHPMTDFHFFLGDRAYHIKHTILPALQEGRTVISDRYSDSTRAYQGVALDGVVPDPEEYIEYNLQHDWHIEPDVTILIDIDAEESARRTSDGDKYEASGFIEQVRQNYLDLEEENPRIIKIDGTQSPEAVVGYCLTIINEAQVQSAEANL